MKKTPGLPSSPLRRARLFALLVLVALGLTACGGGKDKPAPAKATASQTTASQTAAEKPAEHPTEHPAEHPAAAAAQAGASTAIAGVAFTPPAGWQDLGPTNMRQAQYRLAPVGGDTAPGEVNVFYFGAESGGGVDANLQRWIGQMVLPDGGDPAAAAQRSSFTADGMAGHIVSLEGSYKSGGGPMMGGETKILPGYRLVGVVLEGPQGSVFFKLTGPVATAKAMEVDLLKMMQAATKAG